MKENISDRVLKVFEEISKPRIEDVTKTCREEAIHFVFKRYEDLLMPWLVRIGEENVVMHFLGNMENVEGYDIFYRCGHIYERKQYDCDVIPKVEDRSDTYIHNDHHRERFMKYMDGVVARLDEGGRIGELHKDQPVFIFRFMSQWVSGGQETSPIKKIIGMKQHDLCDAVRELKKRLSDFHENYFWDLEIFVGGQWIGIKTDKPIFKFNIDNVSFLTDEIEERMMALIVIDCLKK